MVDAYPVAGGSTQADGSARSRRHGRTLGRTSHSVRPAHSTHEDRRQGNRCQYQDGTQPKYRLGMGRRYPAPPRPGCCCAVSRARSGKGSPSGGSLPRQAHPGGEGGRPSLRRMHVLSRSPTTAANMSEAGFARPSLEWEIIPVVSRWVLHCARPLLQEKWGPRRDFTLA
jgi:hypothetical protein